MLCRPTLGMALAVLATATFAPSAHAATLASFDFTGLSAVNSVAATTLGSGISTASLAAAGPYVGRFSPFVSNDFAFNSTSSTPTADLADAVSRNQYFALDITGSGPYSIDSIDTGDMISQNHPRDWFVLSSADGYTSTLATFSTPAYLSGSQNVVLNLTGLSGTTEVRFYVTGVNLYEAVGFHTAPDQLLVNGSVGGSLAPLPAVIWSGPPLLAMAMLTARRMGRRDWRASRS